MFPKSEPSVKMCFGFRPSFELEWAKKAFVQTEWKLGVTQGFPSLREYLEFRKTKMTPEGVLIIMCTKEAHWNRSK